ncbi:MAG: hypothetical protein ACK58T_03935 [Phycisphaerae bacterium]
MLLPGQLCPDVGFKLLCSHLAESVEPARLLHKARGVVRTFRVEGIATSEQVVPLGLIKD